MANGYNFRMLRFPRVVMIVFAALCTRHNARRIINSSRAHGNCDSHRAGRYELCWLL
jgi:hypothetical protein